MLVAGVKSPDRKPPRQAHDQREGGGVIFITPEGKALFLKRSPEMKHPGEWEFPGGHADGEETPEEAARRETREETGRSPDQIKVAARTKVDLDPEEGEYVTFSEKVNNQFVPELSDENSGYAWAPLDTPPEPLHEGVRKALEQLEKGKAEPQKQVEKEEKLDPDVFKGMDAALAFDRESARSYKDGFLFVDGSNISKANICEYYGNEIPDAEALGLDPHRRYRLLRDPGELEKAASTFNNVPILNEHRPVSATDYPPELVIGSTGTDAEFKPPYLRNSLAIYPKQAIRDIESSRRKELSCGYRYRADMTPGTYEGESYDGVMRDIVGNHVALVTEGRAGSDVVVGDSKHSRQENAIMATARKSVAPAPKSKKWVRSRQADIVGKGLCVFLRPKLAQDAQIDVGPIVHDLTYKNLRQRWPSVVEGVKRACEGKLAKDASIEELAELLDVLEAHPDAIDEGPKLPDPVPPHGDPEVHKEGSAHVPPGQATADGYDAEEMPAFLREKGMDEEGIKHVMDHISSVMHRFPGTGADEEENKGKPPPFGGEPKVGKGPNGKDQEPPNGANVEKKAMDKKARREAERRIAADEAVRKVHSIYAAKAFVRPWVGELRSDLAFDSAEAIYRKTIEMRGHGPAIRDVRGEAALKAILQLIPRAGQEQTIAVDARPAAADAGDEKGWKDRFPGVAEVRIV